MAMNRTTRTPIVRESVAQTIERLQREINGYESHWKMTTSVMIQRIRSGDLRETGEFAEWLITAQYLDDCLDCCFSPAISDQVEPEGVHVTVARIRHSASLLGRGPN